MSNLSEFLFKRIFCGLQLKNGESPQAGILPAVCEMGEGAAAENRVGDCGVQTFRAKSAAAEPQGGAFLRW